MWKDLFSFNRAERRGIWVLSLLATCVWAVQLIPTFWNKESPHTEAEANAKLLAAVEQISVIAKEERSWTSYTRDTSYFRRSYRRDAYRNIGKYRVDNRTPTSSWNTTIVELNTADSASLEQLNGIGKVLASRIIRYRDRLGGFHSLDQLKEVYGLPPDLEEKNAGRITLDPSVIRSFQLDTAGFRLLARHPYIGYERAKMIMGMKRKGRLPQDALALCHTLGIEDSLSLRLLPYIRL